MNWILSPSQINRDDRNRIGGKAYTLSLMAREGFKIPETLFLTVDAYNAFVNGAGLRERILLELNRKKLRTCDGKRSGTVPPAFAIYS